MSAKITTALSNFMYFFKWVIAPKGSSLTHLQLDMIIFQTLSPVRFIIGLFWDI